MYYNCHENVNLEWINIYKLELTCFFFRHMLLSRHNDHMDVISYASINTPEMPASEKKGNKQNTVRASLFARCKQNVTIRKKPPLHYFRSFIHVACGKITQVVSNTPTPNRSSMHATSIWVCACGRPTECLTLHTWARKRPTKVQRNVITLPNNTRC
jgi:hypothetical protein